jgi:hypothetical protein
MGQQDNIQEGAQLALPSQSAEQGEVEKSKAMRVVRWITDQAISGVPPTFKSARGLADEYLSDEGYRDHDHRVSSLVNWETSKNFSTGFFTGLGGLITLPVAVPASIWASWIIQARMAATIAAIHGRDLTEDRVQTLVVLAMLGDSAKEILKQCGVQIANKITQNLIKQVPGKVLIQINQQVGFRLLTKAGTRGVVNLMKWIPIAG